MNQFLLTVLTIIFFCLPARSMDTLTVGYTTAPPFIIENADGSLSGVSIWLWEKVADILDQPFVYRAFSFGNLDSLLTNKVIDICINPLTVTAKRNEIFDFSSVFYVSESLIVIPNLSRWDKMRDFFKALFSPNFIGGVILLVLIIFIFGFLTWRVERKKNFFQFRKGLGGLWDGVWWSAVTMTTVGYGDKAPKTRWGKLIALTWMFVAIIFISSLTASIASSLTITQLNTGQTQLEDLKGKKIATVSNTSTEKYLKRLFFQDVKTYDQLTDGIYAVAERQVDAFVYDKPILQYRIAENDLEAKVHPLSNTVEKQLYAWGFPKSLDPAIANKISQSILDIRESLFWEQLLVEYNLIEQ